MSDDDVCVSPCKKRRRAASHQDAKTASASANTPPMRGSEEVRRLASRPPCPSMPAPHRTGASAQAAEFAVYRWRLLYETPAEYAERKKAEYAQLRKEFRAKRNHVPIDILATLRAYEARLRGMEETELHRLLQPLHNAWIATYGFSGRVSLSHLMSGPAQQTYPKALWRRGLHILIGIALQHGVEPLGIVSQQGHWTADVPPRKVYNDPASPRVYIGRAIQVQKESESLLALLKTDERRVCPQTPTHS